MNIEERLKKGFVYLEKEFVEGEVFAICESFEADQPIKKATLTATSLGLYDSYINGKKTDEQLFKPGYSYYPRRLLYQSHDVTPLLQKGKNELTIYLGQGWYCGRFFCENTVQNYGPHPALSYLLEIEFEDGTKLELSSHPGLEVYSTPYLYAGEYDGEIIDNRIERKLLGKAKSFTPGDFSLVLTSQEVRLQEEMPIKEVIQKEGKTILDFGQNFAGLISINADLLQEGESLTIRHAEIKNDQGELYFANLRKAKATLTYTKGKEKGWYTPRFTYMGFRYVELVGPYQEGLIKANALHTEMKRTGYFESGNKDVNQLYSNLVWGQRSNYVEVPTDCPQRDERLGYTGDGHVYALTGAYNYDTDAFWRNFFEDLRLGQMDNPDGNVPPFLPQVGPKPVGFITMQGWGSAVSIIPEMAYWQFGDERFLLSHYETIRKYVELEISKAGRKNLWMGISLGDWLSLGKGVAWQAMHNHPVSNAFFVKDLRVLLFLAKRLGKKEDADRYEKQLALTKAAYVKKFIRKDGRMKNQYQGSYVMALAHVLEKGDPLYDAIAAHFIRNVKKNGLQTGFFATEHLLPLLCELNESKLAYDVLLSEKCPGWMYQVKRGATTTWERWDAIQEDGKVNESKMSNDNMVSFNHYSFGSVGEFYYRYILGIKPLEPGYKKALIKPYVDERLLYAKGSYESRSGKIVSSWKIEKDKVIYDFEVAMPAHIELEDGSSYDVKPGKHHFEAKKKIKKGERK